MVLGAEHHLISNAVNSTEAAVHVYITGSQQRLTLHIITIVHTWYIELFLSLSLYDLYMAMFIVTGSMLHIFIWIFFFFFLLHLQKIYAESIILVIY